jgi:hypothetical protein
MMIWLGSDFYVEETILGRSEAVVIVNNMCDLFLLCVLILQISALRSADESS